MIGQTRTLGESTPAFTLPWLTTAAIDAIVEKKSEARKGEIGIDA